MRIFKCDLIFFLICLVFNIFFFSLGLSTFGLSWDNLTRLDGDASDYIGSVENFIQGEGFTFYKTNNDKEFVSNLNNQENYNKAIFYSFRSPGFAFFYYPLRLIMSKGHAMVSFLIIQLLFTAFAKLLLCKLGEKLTQSRWVFYSLFALVNLTPLFVRYNNLLITESLGFSFLIFSAYWTFKAIPNSTFYLSRQTKLFLFLGGLSLTIALMLRPFLAIYIPFLGGYFVCLFYKDLKILLTTSLIYFSSFFLIIGIWTIRNFTLTERIIPLAGTTEFHKNKHKAFDEIKVFSRARGLSDRWFDKESPAYWLITKDDSREITDFCPTISNADNEWFNKIKKSFSKSIDSLTPLTERQKIEVKLFNELKAYNTKYRESNRTLVGFLIPLQATYNLLNHDNIRFLHHIKYPFNVAMVFIQSSVLVLVFVCGLIASVLLLFRSNKLGVFIVFLLGSLFLVFYFGFHHQTTERRELYTYSAFFLISVFILLSSLFKLKRKLPFYMISGLFFIITVVLGMQKMISEINW